MWRPWLLLAVLCLGCSRSELLTLPDGGVTDEVLRGTHRPACAPDDGPATRFDLAPVAFACEAADTAALRLTLWTGAPAARSYAVGAFGVGQVQAQRCETDGGCAFAATGAVELERVDAAATVGSFRLTFPSGAVEAASFRAAPCAGVTQCR